jgi:hypothetical protein
VSCVLPQELIFKILTPNIYRVIMLNNNFHNQYKNEYKRYCLEAPITMKEIKKEWVEHAYHGISYKESKGKLSHIFFTIVDENFECWLLFIQTSIKRRKNKYNLEFECYRWAEIVDNKVDNIDDIISRCKASNDCQFDALTEYKILLSRHGNSPTTIKQYLINKIETQVEKWSDVVHMIELYSYISMNYFIITKTNLEQYHYNTEKILMRKWEGTRQSIINKKDYFLNNWNDTITSRKSVILETISNL